LDADSVESRIKMVIQMVQSMDTIGATNAYPLLQLGMSLAFPTFASQLLKSPQSAQQDEIAEAEQNLERNLAGLETQYKSKGGNPALKLQHTQQLIQQPAMDDKGKPMTGPDGQPIPGRIARIIQENPDVAAFVQKTMANYQFLLDQQANATTGRVGVEPVQQPA
jgi:hypothetical protein